MDLGFSAIEVSAFCIWFQNNTREERGRRVSVCVKQTQSQPNPNLALVKISYFFLFPNLSKPSTAEQSALLDQIRCRFSGDIHSSQSLDYTITLHFFCISKLKSFIKAESIKHTLRLMDLNLWTLIRNVNSWFVTIWICERFSLLRLFTLCFILLSSPLASPPSVSLAVPL